MIADNSAPPSPLNHHATGILPVLENKNSLTQVIVMHPTIVKTLNSVASTPSTRSSMKKHVAINIDALQDRFTRRPAISVEHTLADLSYRLHIRKVLQTRLALVCDIASFLALLGIILMVIENELTFNRIDDKDIKTTFFLKLIISVSTVILLALILYYHKLDLKLYSNQNSLEDSFVGLTNGRICLIIIELVICAVHPMPRAYPYSDPPKNNFDSSDPYTLSYTSTDVALGLPMFLRLYLLGRSMMFHSHLARGASLRAFGYLNQVSIDFFFLIKTYLQQWPGRSLFIFCTITFFIGSWSLRACDYTPTRKHLSMSDAMWLYSITFSTIGYGDLYPSTYCGRTIAILSGAVGLLSSALLIAVLAQKLILTREEKYVHTFVSNTQLAKERQIQSANVVKFSVRIWFLKRRNKIKSIQCIQTQRKLFQSIAYLQEIKKGQKNLVDNCVGLHEMMAGQRDINTQHEETVIQITEMKMNMKNIEEKLNNMTYCMDTLQTSLNILLDNIKK